MTPKEKAKELVSKYWKIDEIEFLTDTKECALISVEDIIENVKLYSNYWQEVKQEIELL